MKLKKMMKIRAFVVFLTLTALSCFSCREVMVPKPKGYFRIDLPQKRYALFNDSTGKPGLPLKFEYPVYGTITPDSQNLNEPGWFNIDFPSYRAKIYLTYMDIRNDLADLVEQTYTMNVKNHITKADAINEQVISNSERKVYGVFYDLKGNAATSVQFYVTDSVRHYLRGSLYFASEPNADSLAPVITFFRDDMVHLVETLEWKENK